MESKKGVNGRIMIVSICFVFLFLGITFRLWWIQSVDAAWIIEKAKKQWEEDRRIKQKRGSILDRNGEVLAYEGKAYKVEAKLKPEEQINGRRADTDYVQDPYRTAEKLSSVLKVPADKLFGILTKDKKWVELGREASKISEEQKSQLLALQYPKDANGEPSAVNQMPGIILRETTRRYYSQNNFAPHVLGYTTYDKDEAQMGIEFQFDKELHGEEGELHVVTDAAGYQLPQGERKFKPAKDGNDVYLTIDQQIQDYVEQALDRTEREFKPKKMTVIVSDPQTGEILAMANRPDFDPNQYWHIENYRNHAISSIFEPGSTFKIITLAAAIEEGVFHADEMYTSGSYTNVPGKRINDHNNGRGWGRISFLEGVQRSSNVAFVILGYDRLKQERLSKYFDAFGIGKKTNIELPAEEAGIMRDLKNPRSQRDVAVTTFGQGVAVTAIQQVAAVGAVANGGELLKPYIVKELRDPHTGKVIKRNQRTVVNRVVSANTAKQVRDILETVVTGEHGTGQKFAINGYYVAGKTGTAQKYDDNTGKIVEGRYIVSFIGFAPKDNPRLLVSVVVDDPQTDLPSSVLGGTVVAPIFTTVMEKSLQYLKQQPDFVQLQEKANKQQVATKKAEQIEAKENLPERKEHTMPELTGLSTTAAQLRAEQNGFEADVIGTGTKIVQQYPTAYEKVLDGEKVILITDRVSSVRLPDFTGKSLREVMEFASLVKLQVNTTGQGFVSKQSIPPGTTVTGKETLHVTLVPRSSP